MKRKRKNQSRSQSEKEVHDFIQYAGEQGWNIHEHRKGGDIIFINAKGEFSNHLSLLQKYLEALENGYKTINKDFLRLAANEVAKKFPDGWGFILIAAPLGEGAARTTYTANVDRGDAIKLLKELLFHWGEDENWMKHTS